MARNTAFQKEIRKQMGKVDRFTREQAIAVAARITGQPKPRGNPHETDMRHIGTQLNPHNQAIPVVRRPATQGMQHAMDIMRRGR